MCVCVWRLRSVQVNSEMPMAQSELSVFTATLCVCVCVCVFVCVCAEVGSNALHLLQVFSSKKIVLIGVHLLQNTFHCY